MFIPKVKISGDKSPCTYHSQAGQSFFEFMMLLFIVVLISTVFMGAMRGGISGYWRGAAAILCNHSNTINFDCSPFQ